MGIDRDTLLFFDASCLIAAAASPSGGSGFLLSVCGKGLLRAAVSQPVLLEAERNAQAKLGAGVCSALRRLIVVTPMTVVPVPPAGERRHYAQIVGDKDEHVVVAAIMADAHYLLTLDKRLAERLNAANVPFRALSPGDFIKTVLPSHADYPTMR